MINRNNTEPNWDSIVKQVVDELSKRPEVQGMLLFGSVATGKATSTSDIDLLMICEGESFHVQVDEIENVPIKIVAFPPDGLDDALASEVNQGQYPTFVGGKILYDPKGILSDFCAKINKALDNSPPSLPEQEYDHVRVSITETLRDIEHSSDFATMKLLSSQFITCGIKYYYRIKRWWIPAPKHQIKDLEGRSQELVSLTKDILLPESKIELLRNCEDFAEYILEDIGGLMVYEYGKKYYI